MTETTIYRIIALVVSAGILFIISLIKKKCREFAGRKGDASQ